MKLNLTVLVMAGLSAFFGSLPLAAQSDMKANIPFSFRTQQRTFPAGWYSVQRVNHGSVFAISGANGHSIFVNAPLNEDGTPADPKLTFTCYGSECVLAKISPPYSNVSYGLTGKAIESNVTHKLGVASMISVVLTTR